MKLAAEESIVLEFLQEHRINTLTERAAILNGKYDKAKLTSTDLSRIYKV